MQQTITLVVKGKALAFDVTLDAYNKYLNEVMPGNRIAPARNLLVRTVRQENKEELLALLELPGAPVLLATQLVDEYTPDIEITVGK